MLHKFLYYILTYCGNSILFMVINSKKVVLQARIKENYNEKCTFCI
jgi:hypothetical protein